MSHVLIVDDDAKVRELLRRFLEPSGHEIIEAESAEIAASKASGTARPAWRSCDVHMPGANGNLWLADQDPGDVARAVRQWCSRLAIPRSRRAKRSALASSRT